MELKKKLARIRLQQRDEQREIDEKLAAEGETFKTMFCETCKLIFKQRRMDHNDSDNHKVQPHFIGSFYISLSVRISNQYSNKYFYEFYLTFKLCLE